MPVLRVAAICDSLRKASFNRSIKYQQVPGSATEFEEVYVTGAGGYVGWWIVKLVLKREYAVRVAPCATPDRRRDGKNFGKLFHGTKIMQDEEGAAMTK